jgi:hypothetical protein
MMTPSLHPVFLMSNTNIDLELTSKMIPSPKIMCNHCRTNIAEIFQESGEFCLRCWQERTYPNI